MTHKTLVAELIGVLRAHGQVTHIVAPGPNRPLAQYALAQRALSAGLAPVVPLPDGTTAIHATGGIPEALRILGIEATPVSAPGDMEDHTEATEPAPDPLAGETPATRRDLTDDDPSTSLPAAHDLSGILTRLDGIETAMRAISPSGPADPALGPGLAALAEAIGHLRSGSLEDPAHIYEKILEIKWMQTEIFAQTSALAANAGIDRSATASPETPADGRTATGPA